MKPTADARTWCVILCFNAVVALSAGCGVKGPPVAPEDRLFDTTRTSVEDGNDDDSERESDGDQQANGTSAEDGASE